MTKYALRGVLASGVLALLFVGVEVGAETFFGWEYELSVSTRLLIAFLILLFSTIAVVLSEMSNGTQE
jgi:hypothetical protein